MRLSGLGQDESFQFVDESGETVGYYEYAEDAGSTFEIIGGGGGTYNPEEYVTTAEMSDGTIYVTASRDPIYELTSGYEGAPSFSSPAPWLSLEEAGMGSQVIEAGSGYEFSPASFEPYVSTALTAALQSGLPNNTMQAPGVSVAPTYSYPATGISPVQPSVTKSGSAVQGGSSWLDTLAKITTAGLDTASKYYAAQTPAGAPLIRAPSTQTASGGQTIVRRDGAPIRNGAVAAPKAGFDWAKWGPWIAAGIVGFLLLTGGRERPRVRYRRRSVPAPQLQPIIVK